MGPPLTGAGMSPLVWVLVAPQALDDPLAVAHEGGPRCRQGGPKEAELLQGLAQVLGERRQQGVGGGQH